MKKKNLMWGALVAIAFVSCTQEEVLNNGFGTKTLSVTLEDANYEGSRVGFADRTAAFHWTKGDKIGVTTTKSSTTFQGMTLEGNGGEATGTFSGTFNGTASGYAVYPYGESGRHSVTSEGVLTYTLPAEYTYSTLDTEYAKADGNSHNAPMWGSITNGAVSFKHLGGVIAFSVGNLPANTANMKFVLTATNQISGSFTATLTESEPMITSTSTNVVDADKKVTINFSTAEGQTSGYFYVPVPTGPLGNLSLVILNGQQEVATGAWDNITIARKDIKRATIGSQSIIGGNGEIKQVSSVSNVDAALSTTEDNLTVQVSDEVTGTDNTITIPATLETNTTTFSFSSVADDAKITIENAAGGAYDGQIIIEIPEGETLPEVVATIPDGEVYIKQGNVTTLVVASADNTTIIGAGVVVNTLTVQKGNVRIEDGGIVTTINRSSDNLDEVTYVYFEGEVPSESNSDAKIVYMSAGFVKASGNTYQIKNVVGLRYFRDAVNGGDTFEGYTIELADDLDLDNEEWTSIGTKENPFKGTFDGQNKIIKNLNIVEEEAKEGKAYIGFFGYANNVTIKNVTFENVNLNIACLDIDHSQGHIGAVAGSLEGTSTIENVTVKGDIKVESTVTANGASRVAVVAGGNAYGDVTMKNVHVIANEGSYLKANNNVGALAGQLQGKSVFENCSSNIDVTGTKFFAGGIIGLAAGDQTFTECHTTGDITITAGREGKAHDHYRVGGIAGGWADGAKNVLTITSCSYTGQISGTNADGSVAEAFDYAGYVGRGYTLNGCKGSKVVIDRVEYVQAYNTATEAGIYYVNGVLTINSAANLKFIADKVNSGTNYFEGETIKLGADIDLKNEEWAPIGSATKDHGFMGNFDGNGYVIKNLKITSISPDADGWVYAGLFGVTEGTANNENYIKNLTIENVNIDLNGDIVAAAIAYPYYTTLENIKVKGDITIKGVDYTSGVLAYTRRCVNASNLSIEGNAGSSIEGEQTVGGVISDIQMNGGLTANYSNFKASGLTITAEKNVGGISGIICGQTLDGAIVENVTIVSDDVRKGKISGALGQTSTIKNISVTNVTGATNVVGATYDDGAEVAVNGDVYEKAETSN